MSLPVPKPGLVIRCSFLWSSEHARGQRKVPRIALARSSLPHATIRAATLEANATSAAVCIAWTCTVSVIAAFAELSQLSTKYQFCTGFNCASWVECLHATRQSVRRVFWKLANCRDQSRPHVLFVPDRTQDWIAPHFPSKGRASVEPSLPNHQASD
jgi:hypothetical protein